MARTVITGSGGSGGGTTLTPSNGNWASGRLELDWFVSMGHISQLILLLYQQT